MAQKTPQEIIAELGGMDAPLRVVTQGNPKRKGTRARALFWIYPRIDTVGGFVALAIEQGFTVHDVAMSLLWDSYVGYIDLG